LGTLVKQYLTALTLLMSAFSLPNAPRLVALPLRRIWNAPLPNLQAGFRGFGMPFDRQLFSARDFLMSQLLRTV